jgi:hypothetical protein
MSFSTPSENFDRGKRPWELPPIPADVPAGSGASIAPALRMLLTDPAADTKDLVAAVSQLFRSTTPVFAPTEELLTLLDLPDVAEVRADPEPMLAKLRDAPPGHVAGLALAATLPTAAAAIHLPADIRPSVAGVVITALHTPPRQHKDTKARAQEARDALADAITPFRDAVFNAESARDSGLPDLAFAVLQRLYILRRRLLETTWPERVDCWETLDRIVTATYWPSDAVTLTRMEKRLRAYRFRRWGR